MAVRAGVGQWWLRFVELTSLHALIGVRIPRTWCVVFGQVLASAQYVYIYVIALRTELTNPWLSDDRCGSASL
jgi:hypothetical protein